MAAAALINENIWVDKYRVEDAEYAYHQTLARQRAGLVVQQTTATNHCGGGDSDSTHSMGSDLINEIARARQNIKKSLDNDGVGLKIGVGVDNPEMQARLSAVEQENKDLKSITATLQATVAELTARVTALEKGSSAAPAAAQKAAAPAEEKADDDDFDLFGSDDDEDQEEAARLQEESKKETDAKKPKKVLIAKSSIVLDVKPWDDETDMAAIETHCRSIKTDGLVWGASKLVPVGYGIQKLQIMCVVEDDKVGTDYLEEQITSNDDLVQSMDVFAFNKI